MTNRFVPIETGLIKSLYEEAFRWYVPDREVPSVHISFYPYIGINHTIRSRDGKVLVRIAEICRDMPMGAHKGLAYILTGKLLRKKIPPGAREAYGAYSRSEELRERAGADKRSRGRKVVTSSAGEVYDLAAIFDDLNDRYFAGEMPRPVLTWSARKTYRILGHHDAHHDHIAISRSLDSQNVPRYVVEYVVFHEMLHIAHPARHVGGRKHVHTPAFKRDERKFEHFDAAERWISENVRRLKRAVKKEARQRQG